MPTVFVEYVIGPVVVVFLVFLAASPFALAIHYLIVVVRRRAGTTGAIALYCAEVIALYVWAMWYLGRVTGAIDAAVYDGPVGFVAGIAAGLLMLFAGMLSILNWVGLWRLLRQPDRA